jgi:hypothetical protein
MRRIVPLAVTLALAPVMLAPSAGAAVQAVSHRPLISVGANKSNNWSGYNQGTLEQGNKLFNEVAGDWTVPTATNHKAGEAEFSSTWVGIGGGCIDASCTTTDSTLIQAGTEQDVSAQGVASYSAWWELIPATSVTISTVGVKAGDHVHVDIGEVVANSNVWTITLKNVTSGQTFTMTTPYSSTHATAEWIEETPVVVGTSGTGVGPLPNLSTVNIDLAKANNVPAGLKASEELQLIDSSGNPLSTPSAPDSDTDGFNVCAYASSCSAPTSS